jgi:ketosteroid isomerase-like protein
VLRGRPVSQNVDTFRRATDALNRLDVDGFADCCTADYEWFPVLGGIVEGNSFRGREGIEEYFGELRETWEEFRYVADDVRDLGDRVLTLGRLEGRGRGSGVLVELPIGSLGDYREGRCWRLGAFGDHGEALRAAGLAE